jgi:hypothetical protein
VDPVAGLEAEYAVYRCEFYAYQVRGLLILLLYFFICSLFIGAGSNSGYAATNDWMIAIN